MPPTNGLPAFSILATRSTLSTQRHYVQRVTCIANDLKGQANYQIVFGYASTPLNIDDSFE